MTLSQMYPIVESEEGEDLLVNNKTSDKPRGFCCKVLHFLKGTWSTRQLIDLSDRETVVRTTLRELVLYIIFLVLLCIVTFGMTSPTMFFYTNVLSTILLDTPYTDTKNTFRGSTQVLDFWRFVEGPLLDGLYWDSWYDRARVSSDPLDSNILYENRLLGLVRLRQVRVSDESCALHEDIAPIIGSCYSSYSRRSESVDAFGPRNGTAWVHSSEKRLDSDTVWGKLATYSGSGYYVDLPLDRPGAVRVLRSLRDHLWIGRATRAVFVDFTVYNVNVNLFCVVRLLFEFPATGGMITSHQFRTIKLIRYVTNLDYFIMGCEWVFAAMVVYYIIEEVLEIWHLKCAYFGSAWNCLDIVVVAMATLCCLFSVYRMKAVEDKLTSLINNNQQYANFEKLSFHQVQFNSALALLMFFAWIRLFKYINFNRTMTQLSSTLSRCAKDIVGFSIMFLIIFCAFAQMGYLLFGTQVKDYSTMTFATFTLLRTILGDFDFQEIQSANRVLGPVFFIVYVLFVFLVLMNMFLAIINETYTDVKTQITASGAQFQMADYFRRGYTNMLSQTVHGDGRMIDVQSVLKLADNDHDGCLTFDEIRTQLKTCNFSDLEIEMFFAKYDQNGDRTLSHTEIELMLSDLETHRYTLEDDNSYVGGGKSATQSGGSAVVNNAELADFSDRVHELETTIESTATRLNLLLDTIKKAVENKQHTTAFIYRLKNINNDPKYDDKQRMEQLKAALDEKLCR